MSGKLEKALRDVATEARRAANMRYFKTGKGEYGEGDVFIGVTVPAIRAAVQELKDELTLDTVVEALRSPIHEMRLAAIVWCVDVCKRKKESQELKADIYNRLMHGDNRKFINNWDLVDTAAAWVFGEHLKSRDRQVLHDLLESDYLWDRRIAVITCQAFIRDNDFSDIKKMAERLIEKKEGHDLMHKAVGWMLREMGNRSKKDLLAFLEKHHSVLPKTAFRYATEKLSEKEKVGVKKGPSTETAPAQRGVKRSKAEKVETDDSTSVKKKQKKGS